MNAFLSRLRLSNHFSVNVSSSQRLSSLVSVQRGSKNWFSTGSVDNENGDEKKIDEGVDYDDLINEKYPELEAHGVDPERGWSFRGVYKAIICGRVGQPPVQKILRNGRSLTAFTVGTGGLFDQRLLPGQGLPRPAQWHRIAVHCESLGTYAVQKLVKNSSVYVEGDIETRIFNDSISGEVKYIPEICVRRDGKIRLINYGESASSISFDDLREGLF